jgi:hypothetical protein
MLHQLHNYDVDNFFVIYGQHITECLFMQFEAKLGSAPLNLVPNFVSGH